MRIAANNRSLEYLTKLSMAQSTNIKIEVTDLKTNTSTIYHAIRAAARELKIDKRYIENYINLNQDNPVLDRYIFKLVNPKDEDIKLINEKVIQKTSIKLEVINVKTKEVNTYLSIGSASRALCIRQGSISLYLKENRTKPYKGIYLFKIIKD